MRLKPKPNLLCKDAKALRRREKRMLNFDTKSRRYKEKLKKSISALLHLLHMLPIPPIILMLVTTSWLRSQPFFCTFCQVSFRVAVRLKTGFSGVLSIGSRWK